MSCKLRPTPFDRVIWVGGMVECWSLWVGISWAVSYTSFWLTLLTHVLTAYGRGDGQNTLPTPGHEHSDKPFTWTPRNMLMAQNH